MGLSKEIILTVKDYEVKLNRDIKFYENDTIDLCFSILEYGIEVKDGVAVNKLMPINALKSYMLIETPQGVDYAESTKVENNRVVFNLGDKYSQFIGIGKMQIVIKDNDGCRVTLPEFPFEIRESINSNWDRDITVLSTEKNEIIIDEFGRKIELKKISEMEEANILPIDSYSMILDNNENKKIKTNLITQKIENDLQLVNEQLDNIRNEEIANISTILNNNVNEVNKKLNVADFDYNKINNRPYLNFNNYVIDNNIYSLDKLQLLDTTWSYYDGTQHPQFYPSCGMNESGEIYFQGLAKLDDSKGQTLDRGMVRFAKLFHFNIERFEGVPMWGTFIGINDDDENDSILIPFQIRPNGDILIKNLGQGNKYYKRIDLNGAKVQTSSFGKEKIIKHIRSVENTVLNHPSIDATLLYFTDMHHNLYGGDSYRRYEQYKYINLVNRELDIICNITGGDNIEEYDSRVKAKNTMRDFLTQFERDKLVYCNGNHDHNTMNGANIFLAPDHVKPYINNSKTIYGGRDKYYGFTDYTERKLRVIQLDTHEATFSNNSISVGGVSDEQINWIKNNALMNCPSDYNIIVVSHVAPTNKVYDEDTVLSNAYTIRTLFENFKNGTGDFAGQGQRKLCCWLSGHEHADKIVTVNGISYVNTLLASSQEVGYTPQGGSYTQFTRELGTEYEFCFDIVSIDNTNRKVYFDRVGRVGNIQGRTREISF